jgi:hypothetical protein
MLFYCGIYIQNSYLHFTFKPQKTFLKLFNKKKKAAVIIITA